MLRRVVVENYVIFKGRHELDFDGKDDLNFYTFVGENASGKSSLVALIKAASNLEDEGADFEVIANGTESKVVCQFEFDSGAEVVRQCQHCNEQASGVQSVSSGLSSWFTDNLLKIPTPFYEQINTVCGQVQSKVQVFAGHKRLHGALPDNSWKLKGQDFGQTNNLQFLYFVMEEGILVGMKICGTLRTGFHDSLPAGVNPADWVPQRSFLHDVKEIPLYQAETVPAPPSVSSNASSSSLDSLFHQTHLPRNTSLHSSDVPMETGASDQHGDDVAETHEVLRHLRIQSDVTRPSLATALLGRPPWRRQSSFGSLAWSNYHELKKIIVAELLSDFPEDCLSEIHPLFHEIIGDKYITFELNVPDEPFQVVDNKTKRVMRRIPEGLFSAFIIAALLVKPSSRNVILDEPTRGMHPLQIRRLRNILMRESVRRRKCIIATTHSPELLDCDRITLIWRFQLLHNGYCQIRRVTARYSERELLFIGGAEVREIFFCRHIIWVEGESDKRFIEALLSLFDEGRSGLFKALQEHDGKTLSPAGDTRKDRSSSKPTPRGTDAYVRNLLRHPAYERRYYTAEELSLVQEAVRSCKVLSVGGKMNLWKGAAICRDLHIPYSIICDLDAIVPNSRENSIQSQFERAEGDWFAAGIPHAKSKLLDDDESPASKAIDETDHAQLAKLRSCRVVGEVSRFYEQEQYVFTWWPMGGEIEDAVRLTKAQFGKKLWPDMLSEEIKSFIMALIDPRNLLIKDPKDKEARKGPNLEILRCIYFLIRFFKETLDNIN